MSQMLAPWSAGEGAAAHPPLQESGTSGRKLATSAGTRADAGENAVVLLRLQSALLGHYFRLQQAERKLSIRARKSRPSTGRVVVRQIELERQRLGRELHTGVGQMLAAIRLQLEVIAAELPEAPAAVRQALGRISTLAADALEQVRAVSRRLHPPEWQRLTIEAALQQLWEISGIPQKFEAVLRIEPLPAQPELEVKAMIYRTAQEAFSNLTRHSRATRVELTLAVRGDNVVLSIRDNGVGFDAGSLFSAPASIASGIGLRSLRDQAESIGGNLMIESGPTGTKLEFSAPLTLQG